MRSFLRKLIMPSVLVICLGAVGCACSAPETRQVAVSSRPYLVFPPEPLTFAPEGFVRNDWPVAYNGLEYASWTGFREVIIDRQGPGNDDRNNYYRRFDSARWGVLVR